MSKTKYRSVFSTTLDQAGCLKDWRRVDIFIDDVKTNEVTPLETNNSKFICFHRDLTIGSPHQYKKPDDLFVTLEEEGYNLMCLPIYMSHEDVIKLHTKPLNSDKQCLIGIGFVEKSSEDGRKIINDELEKYEKYLNKAWYCCEIYRFDAGEWKLEKSLDGFEGSDFLSNSLFSSAGLLKEKNMKV